MYAQVAELRAEGVGVTQASDARLALLLEEATAIIDRLTGWFFEPRLGTFWCHGRGSRSIEPSVPPIRVDRIETSAGNVYTTESLVVVGAPVTSGFDGPRISLRQGRFPEGYDNVIVSGLWGFTEPDGTPMGRTPLAVRRACMLLVLRSLAPLGDEAAQEARTRWRIVEERTRDQAYKLDAPRASGPMLTGDPDIDALLIPYVRPPRIGGA